ncbi:MAG: sterol desaturase family protein [Saprospiraceae bacterium]
MENVNEQHKGSIFQTILTYTLYPLILFIPITLGLLAVDYVKTAYPNNTEFWFGIIMAAVSLGVMLFVIFMEYVYPEHKAWVPKWEKLKHDILHLLFTSVIPPTLFRALFEGLLVAFGVFIASKVGFSGFWPNEWPLFFQMILAVHLGDMGYYILHRSLHEVPRIWPYHAVHHSPDELYVIASNRAHPIQIFFTYGVQLVILWTLGINAEALLMFSIFVAVNGQLQHCNIHMRCGIFNWLFATPDLHRWHHSIEIRESNSNYGNNVVLWDILLGTRFLPKQVSMAHDHIGLPEGTNFPNSYFGHFMVPFEWENVRYDRKENEEAYKKRMENEKTIPKFLR